MTRAGFPISGHTELLKELTGARDVRMMLAGSRLRVVLVTMHVALGEVPQALNVRDIARTITIAADAPAPLSSPGRSPASRSRVSILTPVRTGSSAARRGASSRPRSSGRGAPASTASGPYPADSLFFQAVDGKFDAVIAMYHDQGLIPLKLLHFHDAVNVTLGLPIIRTSPDHGTAYDIAGKGTADAGSMIEAIALAHAMSRASGESRA